MAVQNNRDLSKDCQVTNTILCASNSKRQWLVIQNVGSYPVYVNPTTYVKNEPATANKGICLASGSPGGVVVFDKSMPYYEQINGIAVGGISALLITESYFD